MGIVYQKKSLSVWVLVGFAQDCCKSLFRMDLRVLCDGGGGGFKGFTASRGHLGCGKTRFGEAEHLSVIVSGGVAAEKVSLLRGLVDSFRVSCGAGRRLQAVAALQREGQYVSCLK
jgi:hypothetical protein